jgi:hypothetical protein
MDSGEGPRPGARDNGLRCASYLTVGDLDPRIAESLLDALRDEGIAAYVVPTPGARGGYLEVQVPARLTDRLFADATHLERARELLPAPDATLDIDFDSAWRQVLTSLQSPGDSPVPPWPVSEDLDAPSTRQIPLELPIGSLTYSEEPEEHFVPPPPPPLPRLRRVTIVSLLSIAAGLLILATDFDGGDLFWIAIVAIASGVGGLVWHMKDGPPTDSGWDDGAVV